MDWNRCVVIGSQVAVLCVLGALVATGHDSLITDGLMVVSGSLVGHSLVTTIVKPKADKPTE